MTTPLSPLFIEILQAPLQRLVELKLTAEFESSEQENYFKILLHFLSAETEELEKAVEESCHKSVLSSVGKLRLQYLKNEISEEQILLVQKVSSGPSPFAGEASFALGIVYWRLKRNLEARDIFKKAFTQLALVSVKQKSVKALLNVVVSESRIDKTRRLFQDYEVVALHAKTAGSLEVEGICYQNISKELHILKAHELALKYSHQALNLLEEQDFNSLHYYESLLHRCHVLIDLGRFREAYSDFSKAKISKHPQTIEAIKCIQMILGEKQEFGPEVLEPAWVSKLQSLSSITARPTQMEMEFIDLIKGKKVSKEEVILKLYGDTDWESARNRFKVFLNRFRKKYTTLVEEENGFFRIVDESVLNHMDKAE